MNQFETEIKRRFKFVEGKEHIFVYCGLAIVYIVLIGLIIFVYYNLVDKAALTMKFDSEKSFNSVYMALVENPSKVKSTMDEEGVLGIAIYSSNGYALQHVGDAMDKLPLSKLSAAKKSGSDSTLGLYTYDSSTKEIEYFRLSRFNVAIETGVFGLDSSTSTTEVPEIVYIKFQGETYFASVARAGLFSVIAVILVSALIVLTVVIYKSNRNYRQSIAKNENLIHMGEAARTLTHEIKNPLSALTLQSALMKKTLPDRYKGDLDVIDQELTRLTNLTNRVSEFVRNPIGNPVSVDVVDLVLKIASLFKVPVNVSLPESSEIMVSFDPDRARSVFENLIKNATESCTDRDPCVEIHFKNKKNCVCVMVLDRGDGIPKENMDKLFNPFFTTKINGSGIGLSISQQFVKAVGGSLRISDRDGGGTVAEVILPKVKGGES